MKRPAGKFIGINQRVPYQVLDRGLARLLQSGHLNREDIQRDMLEFTGGANRAHKATQYAVTILSRPAPLLEVLKQHLSVDVYLRLPEHERKALITALLACAFPLAYDLLIALAAGFKVQTQLSKATMDQKMSALYGSNRTLDIAIEALLPMCIELGLIVRAKPGVYTLAPASPLQTPIIAEAYLYADIMCSGSKSILAGQIESRPWYVFHPVQFDRGLHNHVLRFLAGGIGGGYVAV